MDTPFIFGKVAKEENFTDRKKETALLVSNFDSLINTIIISPRRWGKSSLVYKASQIASANDPALRICKIDLFNVRNEEQFYSSLAQTVIKATSSRWEEAVENAKKFMTRIIPKIALGNDPMNEISFEFDWEEVKRDPDEILDLAENISAEKGYKVVICIDEFQNIAEFEDSLQLQKKLRSHWQQHQHVAYCLYGSKRHMMQDVFTSSSMPFYKFGDILYLEKIATPQWVDFICGRFSATGKQIDGQTSKLIVALADNHPYYVQQLAQQAWLRTEDKCNEGIVTEAHSALVEQLSLLFVTMTETLTYQQLNLLKAMVSGEKSFSSARVMSKYHISSSSMVTRARQALIDKDILDSKAGVISFQDPIYSWWLKHDYFI